AIKAGRFQHVPMVIGTCAGDGTVLHAPLLFGVVSLEKSMRKLFGDDATKILALYPRQGLTPGQDILRDFRTDIAFIAPARRLAPAVSANGGTILLYHFSRVCPEMAQYKKAPHGAEVYYAFGKVPARGTEPLDQDLADVMSAALVRFAATGDPNGE